MIWSMKNLGIKQSTKTHSKYQCQYSQGIDLQSSDTKISPQEMHVES
jgi:hypothetical protein